MYCFFVFLLDVVGLRWRSVGWVGGWCVVFGEVGVGVWGGGSGDCKWVIGRVLGVGVVVISRDVIGVLAKNELGVCVWVGGGGGVVCKFPVESKSNDCIR